jgi:hypothetical protein
MLRTLAFLSIAEKVWDKIKKRRNKEIRTKGKIYRILK